MTVAKFGYCCGQRMKGLFIFLFKKDGKRGIKKIGNYCIVCHKINLKEKTSDEESP